MLLMLVDTNISTTTDAITVSRKQEGFFVNSDHLKFSDESTNQNYKSSLSS